jgi:hypothetical protein
LPTWEDDVVKLPVALGDLLKLQRMKLSRFEWQGTQDEFFSVHWQGLRAQQGEMFPAGERNRSRGFLSLDTNAMLWTVGLVGTPEFLVY